MSPIYDFTCSCGEVTEARQGYGVETIPCPACGQAARRAAFYDRQFIVGDTVARHVRITPEKKYRVSDYVEASSEIDYAHTRAEQTQGRKLPRPDLYGTAKRRAAAMGAKIRPTPSP